MNALELRDELFSQIHVQGLKPRGYKKSANWSCKWVGEFLFGVTLRSSRWCTTDSVQCWIDIKVFHHGCHKAVLGQTLARPKESTPSLFFEELGTIEGPEHRLIKINPFVDITQLKHVLLDRLSRQQAPLEESFQSLGGAITYLKARPDWPRLALSAATAALVLGKEQEATTYFQLARNCAPSPESAAWVEQRELQMRKNLGMAPS